MREHRAYVAFQHARRSWEAATDILRVPPRIRLAQTVKRQAGIRGPLKRFMPIGLDPARLQATMTPVWHSSMLLCGSKGERLW